MPDKEIVLTYITNPSLKEAKKIAEYLLGKKLIACANILPSESIYPWKGKVVKEKEYILIAKTLAEKFEKVKNEVEKIHSYDIPCIIKIPTSTDEKYFNWIVNNIE